MGNNSAGMKIHILRDKITKSFIGYTISEFSVSTENPKHEYILCDLPEDQFGKVERGWKVSFDLNDKITLVPGPKTEIEKIKEDLKKVKTIDELKQIIEIML